MAPSSIDEIIKLSQNENPLGSAPSAKKIIEEYSHIINRYPEPHSDTLRARLAEWHDLDIEEVFVSAGLTEAIDIIIKNLIPPGYHMITADVTFVAYKLIAQVFGIDTKYIPLKDFTFDVNAIIEAADEKTSVILIANPNNPTGTVIHHDELELLLKSVSKETIVVIDEAYYEYVDDPDYPRSFDLRKQYPNLLILRTFSKMYGLAGMRVGYAVASPEISEKLNRFQAPFTVSQLASKAASASLDDTEYVQTCFRFNQESRQMLVERLSNFGAHVVPSQSNFFYLAFSSEEVCDRIYNMLTDNNILTRQATLFGDRSALRISIGTSEQIARMVSCFESTEVH